MRQWKSLVALHAAAPSCFPHPPSPSPCPSPPRNCDSEEQHLDQDLDYEKPCPPSSPKDQHHHQQQVMVRLVGSDGRVRAYTPPVTARELMQQHPRHLVCRADALLIGEKIPAVAPGEELQPGQAYFLLPAHLFRSVLSFVSLASSLLLLLSTATASSGKGGSGCGKVGGGKRPFELQRTASGTLRIKFSDDFLVGGADDESADEEKKEKARPAVLQGDERLEKEYEELVGYGKSRRWAPKLEPIQEIVIAPSSSVITPEDSPSSPTAASPPSSERRKSRGLPFLGRLGSQRRRDSSSTSSSSSSTASSAALAASCSGASAVACSG